MILIPILLALVTTVTPQKPKEVRTQFLELAAQKDRAGCLTLWKANPGAVLLTIDADLEGSLKAREKSGGSPDAKAVGEMHARALWGAEIAFEATGDPLVLDYTSAFVGWDEPQQKRFREGQQAFRAVTTAMKSGDAKAALASGQTCLDCAAPLGDWWGTAMGYDAIAAAHTAAGAFDKALEAASRARAIYHSLGLEGDEYQSATQMAELCVRSKRAARGKVACQIALGLAKKLGDADGEKALLAQQAALEALEKPAGPAK